MKTNLLILGLLAVLLAGLAYGQITIPLTANVPFPFYVGDKAFPSDRYSLSFPGYGLAAVETSDGKEKVFATFNGGATLENGKAADTCQLVFTRYPNGRTFLRQIWHAGAVAGKELPKTRFERESVTSTFRAGLRPVNVTVIAYMRR